MKQFRDTLGDKKMNDKSRRDRALTSSQIGDLTGHKILSKI